jgi:hypothetical protein
MTYKHKHIGYETSMNDVKCDTNLSERIDSLGHHRL